MPEDALAFPADPPPPAPAPRGEVEIARLIPPQLVDRMENRADVSVIRTDSIEQMFLGLNNAFKPWDDVRVRRAASHAIDRDLIIKKLFNGEASRLDGPVGSKPSVCYAGGVKDAYAYDPALAKKLLAEAGYKDGGPEIELLTSNNRLIADKQVSEVIGQMLSRVGFKVKVQILEYAKLWSLVRPGKAPTYYFNRGSVFEPTDSMSQYFETGGSPRIGYSNPKFDELIARVRQEFNEPKRCELLNEAAAVVVNDAPVVYLWTHSLVSGVRKSITYPANASGEIWVDFYRDRRQVARSKPPAVSGCRWFGVSGSCAVVLGVAWSYPAARGRTLEGL